jgi:hypothetical protein
MSVLCQKPTFRYISSAANPPSVVDNARQVQSAFQNHSSEELLPNAILVELTLNQKATRLDTQSSPQSL